VRPAHPAGEPDTYQFTRTTAGVAKPVPPSIEAWRPDTEPYRYWTFLCWLGTNDLSGKSAAEILALMDAYVSWQATAVKRRTIIMPVINSAAENVAGLKTKYAQLLALVKAKWPYDYIDTLFELQRANDGSHEDLADVAAGLVPRSKQGSDTYHLNNAGYGVIAAAVKALSDRRGF